MIGKELLLKIGKIIRREWLIIWIVFLLLYVLHIALTTPQYQTLSTQAQMANGTSKYSVSWDGATIFYSVYADRLFCAISIPKYNFTYETLNDSSKINVTIRKLINETATPLPLCNPFKRQI